MSHHPIALVLGAFAAGGLTVGLAAGYCGLRLLNAVVLPW